MESNHSPLLQMTWLANFVIQCAAVCGIAGYVSPKTSILEPCRRSLWTEISFCVFEGGRPLFVVRKREDETRYQLIGPAYVRGLMNGEALTSKRYLRHA